MLIMISLREADAGENYVICGIKKEGQTKRLCDLGIISGAGVRVLFRNGGMIARIGKTTYGLRGNILRDIYVEHLNERRFYD